MLVALAISVIIVTRNLPDPTCRARLNDSANMGESHVPRTMHPTPITAMVILGVVAAINPTTAMTPPPINTTQVPRARARGAS